MIFMENRKLFVISAKSFETFCDIHKKFSNYVHFLTTHLPPRYHHPLSHTTRSVRSATEIYCIILKNGRKLMFYAILLHQMKAFESFFTMNE